MTEENELPTTEMRAWPEAYPRVFARCYKQPVHDKIWGAKGRKRKTNAGQTIAVEPRTVCIAK